jgi:hypothetical protein
LPPGAAHRNVTDEVHGRLDRRKTASTAIRDSASIGNKESQMPPRGRPASGVTSSSTAKPKAGVRQGKLKLVPDDQK